MDLIKYIFLIFIFGSSPIPSLPIIIISYKENGFLGGFITAVLGGALANFTLYIIGRFLRKYFYRFNYFQKAINLSSIIKGLSFRDLYLIRQASILPSKLTSLGCGFVRYSFMGFSFSFILSSIPCQFLYFYFATKVDIISGFFDKFGFNISISYASSILSSCAICFLSLYLIKIILKRFFKNSFLFKKIIKKFFI